MALIKKTAVPRDAAKDERASARDFGGLIHQLDDADPAARRWAARDLGVQPNASTALLERLQRGRKPAQ
jgi:hypothetical protein